MGLQESRESQLPIQVNNILFKQKIIQSWVPQNILIKSVNSQQYDGRSTLKQTILVDAFETLCYFIQTNMSELTKIQILDIYSGNGCASKLLYDQLQTIDLQVTHILTDIITYPNRLIFGAKFSELNTIDAVAQYGEETNILILISPPPSSDSIINDSENHKETNIDYGYSDYYAIQNYIELCNEKAHRYIVFIGELGASDGSTGLYRFMMEHQQLQLQLRKMLQSGCDFFGGPIEKELFIFHII